MLVMGLSNVVKQRCFAARALIKPCPVPQIAEDCPVSACWEAFLLHQTVPKLTKGSLFNLEAGLKYFTGTIRIKKLWNILSIQWQSAPISGRVTRKKVPQSRIYSTPVPLFNVWHLWRTSCYRQGPSLP